jgi:heme exporter protein B
MMSNNILKYIIRRDLLMIGRRRIDAVLPVGFFVVAASLFPFGIGPEANTLREIAPGIMWVCALLSAMLSLNTLYASDYADGSLEQMLLSGRSLFLVAAGKAIAHWLTTGLPLILATPVLGVLFGMHTETIAILMLSLLLGTPVLSLLGGLGAALTLGVRSNGILVFLLILPLCIPVLIFGTGAVAAVDINMSPRAHLYLIGAFLLVTCMSAPLATAAALRIAHA